MFTFQMLGQDSSGAQLPVVLTSSVRACRTASCSGWQSDASFSMRQSAARSCMLWQAGMRMRVSRTNLVCADPDA